MMLPLLIGILMVGGILAWIAARWSLQFSRWIACVAVLANLIATTLFWIENYRNAGLSTRVWLLDFNYAWIPSFGISFHLGLDGLSLLMLLLTFFLGLLAILVSWKEVQFRVGFFHFNLLWVLAGITGVFITLDLFLFYFFWEVMLIPMYFLIGIWGHENRRYAAYKFFIFTQASGLLMFLAILGFYFVYGSSSGRYTFDYFHWLEADIPIHLSWWLMLGFVAAFVVKLPAVPFHTWLPDAHTEAPTAGSLILAGLLLKTGAYGLLRFAIPLFPEAAHRFSGWAVALGVVGILYGAVLAFSQKDLKRLVAYTSVSHMGFVILGAFTFNTLALQGVVMQMITHGISTGALFILAGAIYERIHSRNIEDMGGFWTTMPFMGVVALVFAMASLGLPGLGNFVAEFLILAGTWQHYPALTIFATIGLVLATVYSLRIVQRVFYGMGVHFEKLPDLSWRERLIMLPMVVVIIALGLFPQPVFHTAGQAIDKVTDAGESSAESATVRLNESKAGERISPIKMKGGVYE